MQRIRTRVRYKVKELRQAPATSLRSLPGHHRKAKGGPTSRHLEAAEQRRLLPQGEGFAPNAVPRQRSRIRLRRQAKEPRRSQGKEPRRAVRRRSHAMSSEDEGAALAAAKRRRPLQGVESAPSVDR